MDSLVPSSSHAEQQSSTFSQFQEFPLEIRQYIWEAALPGPRVIMFQMEAPHDGMCFQVRSDIDVDGPSNDEFFDFEFMIHFRQSFPGRDPRDLTSRTFGPARSYTPRFFAKTPIITAVCRESRAVAEKSYTMAFGSPISSPRVWFSFERDTLHMSEDVIATFESGLYSVTDLGPDFAKVQHISIAESYLQNNSLQGGPMGHQIPHRWCSKTISWFGSLQSITFTIIPSFQSFKGDLILVEIQDVAAMLDRVEKINDQLSEPYNAWPMTRTKLIKAPLDGWERGVVEAISKEVEERAKFDDFRGVIPPRVDCLKIYRMVLTTAQDPHMTLLFDTVMKELEGFEFDS
ncbi:hypothetical protein ONS95_004167 [Cadophora gregata]|uniref:uncharacterized protein n=1 Tax=Cadophora gregata TaxID=51156 RepID=UPI0026DBFA87|nr:uncharacterized protein ONS95_004167 [Cadophora gregata]KAK0105637.1 hypothetical protein ONS95_004167 [Cadophora gregata]